MYFNGLMQKKLHFENCQMLKLFYVVINGRISCNTLHLYVLQTVTSFAIGVYSNHSVKR